jgi:uncharacterized membrane-anchored protein
MKTSMTTSGKKIAFALIVTLQVAALLILIAQRVYLLESGRRVLLQCKPIDPRSLLSGDYVVLRYGISEISNEELQRVTCDRANQRCKLPSFARHDWVYVALEPKGAQPVATIAAIARDRTSLARYPIVLRGRVRHAFDPSDGGALRLRYGVESYFVPQHEGKRIERQLDKAWVEVAVASSGVAAVRRLFIAGQQVVFR